MTDFVIVVAAIASLASAAPPGAGSAVIVPDTAPTVGFRTYPSADACTEAAAKLTARPGTRLVCLPVEAQQGELQSAW
jgi:hypothetical protein